MTRLLFLRFLGHFARALGPCLLNRLLRDARGLAMLYAFFRGEGATPGPEGGDVPAKGEGGGDEKRGE